MSKFRILVAVSILATVVGFWLNWMIGVAIVLIVQSATFSSYHVAFSIMTERKVKREPGDRFAHHLCALKAQPGRVIAMILFANLIVNTAFTLIIDNLLEGSMRGIAPDEYAALASKVVVGTVSVTGIFILGELLPQGAGLHYPYFVATRFAPIIRGWNGVLGPAGRAGAKIFAMMGRERTEGRDPETILELLRDELENPGRKTSAQLLTMMVNVATLGDQPIASFARLVHPASIHTIPRAHGKNDFKLAAPRAKNDSPRYAKLRKEVGAGNTAWDILVDEKGEPCYVVDSRKFAQGIKNMVDDNRPPLVDIHSYCHPAIVVSGEEKLCEVLQRWQVDAEHPEDHVVDLDVLVVWLPGNRLGIVTASDIFGRLLKGVVRWRLNDAIRHIKV